MATNEAERLLERLDLPEYERTALRELLTLGRTTAPDLAEATGIPKARIYGVLDELVDRGFVELIPERPKKYQPKPPEDILDRAIENERQSYEQSRAEIEEIRDEFLDTFGPLYETAAADVTPTEELFAVVDVGDPSETETRKLYHEADQEVRVLTKSFEYFPSVEPAFAEAVDRDIDVSVLFVDPDLLSADNRPVQEDRVQTIREEYPSVGVRFSKEPLPWRGTFADPSMEYDSGTAILLVEEEDVPLHRRKAAVTENGSFVAGLSQYFDLIWDHESTSNPRQDRS